MLVLQDSPEAVNWLMLMLLCITHMNTYISGSVCSQLVIALAIDATAVPLYTQACKPAAPRQMRIGPLQEEAACAGLLQVCPSLCCESSFCKQGVGGVGWVVSCFGASAEAGGVASGFSRRHIEGVVVLPIVAVASHMIDWDVEGVCASSS